MEKVAYFIRTYLFPSEVFIYEEIKSIERFKVIVLAQNVINTRLSPILIFLPPREKRQVFPPVRKVVGNQADLFITRSFSMKEDVVKLGCPPEKEIENIYSKIIK